MLHFKFLIFSENVTNLKLYCSVSFFLQFSEKMLQYFCLLARKRGEPMELNQKELKKLEIIKKVIKKEMTINEATNELKISRQQVYRLINVYNTQGEQGFIHKNRGKNNPNKKDKHIFKEIENLYLNEYYDFNFEHFFEEIENVYNISYSSLYRFLLEHDIISPLAHKNTVKIYNDKMKELINEGSLEEKKEIIQLFESRINEVEKAHIRRSSNLYCFGEEIQMDACEKLWFGGIVSFLHLALDKATKKVLFGWFEFEEITRGYFVLLFHIIINYGIPVKIKADNRSSFSANNTKNKDKKLFLTQFGKVCEELNITLETTSIATAKAHIERENKTFKDRLIAELRHEGITTIDEANRYLNEIFIPKMNEKFSYAIDKKKSKIKENNYSEDELNLIISEKYTRIIDNASCVRYNKKYYVPTNPDTGEIVSYKKGTECLFIISYNGDYWCLIENKYYQLTEIEQRDTTMIKEEDIPKSKEKEHHKYIPPKDHPWRKNMMLR